MAARASRTSEEKRLAGRNVTSRGRSQAAETGRRDKAAKIGDELPDLRISDPGKRGHLRAAYAGANGAEETGVGAAVRKCAAVQCRAAVAAALTGRTVAALAELTEQRLARAGRGGAAGKRIGRRAALLAGNGGRPEGGEQENGKSA